MSQGKTAKQSLADGAGKDAWSFSRRTFLKGSAAMGSGALLAGSLAGCNNALVSEDSGAQMTPVVVDESNGTSVTDSFSYTDSMTTLSQVAEWSLPVGAVPQPATGNWIPTLVPATLASSLVAASVFSIASGSLVPLFTQPISQGKNYVLLYLAGSDELISWVEIEMNTRSWTLYAQQFAAGSLTGSPQTLMTQDSGWDPPQPVVSASTVVWQILPTTTGPYSKESSKAYVWNGSGSPRVFLESKGRFATKPAITGNTCTLTPRAEGTNQIFYVLANYDLVTFATRERLMLPQSVRPFSVSWINNNFVFQIGATYSSGGLLGKMGTFIAEGTNSFVYVAREPLVSPAYVKGLYIVKSQASYIEVDEDASAYSVLRAANRSLNWGEYPVRVGESSDFLTFSTVKNYDTGLPEATILRRFA